MQIIQWQRDATSDLLEWLKSNGLTKPRLGEDMEHLDLSHTAGRDVKSYNHLEKRFGSLLKS